MLIIKTDKNSDTFFNNILAAYPDQISIEYEHGFDGNAITQVIIEVLDVVIPSIVASVSALLTYKIAKKQLQLQERELQLKERANQEKKGVSELDSSGSDNTKLYFEIYISDNNTPNDLELLVSNSDLDVNGITADQLISKILEALNNE